MKKGILLAIALSFSALVSTSHAGEGSIKSAIKALTAVEAQLTVQAAQDDKGGKVSDALDNVRSAISSLESVDAKKEKKSDKKDKLKKLFK